MSTEEQGEVLVILGKASKETQSEICTVFRDMFLRAEEYKPKLEALKDDIIAAVEKNDAVAAFGAFFRYQMLNEEITAPLQPGLLTALRKAADEDEQ